MKVRSAAVTVKPLPTGAVAAMTVAGTADIALIVVQPAIRRVVNSLRAGPARRRAVMGVIDSSPGWRQVWWAAAVGAVADVAVRGRAGCAGWARVPPSPRPIRGFPGTRQESHAAKRWEVMGAWSARTRADPPFRRHGSGWTTRDSRGVRERVRVDRRVGTDGAAPFAVRTGGPIGGQRSGRGGGGGGFLGWPPGPGGRGEGARGPAGPGAPGAGAPPGRAAPPPRPRAPGARSP